MMLVIYLSSLIRSVIALHNLINNKVRSASSLVSLSHWSQLWSCPLLFSHSVGKFLKYYFAITDAKQGAREGRGFEASRDTCCGWELNVPLFASLGGYPSLTQCRTNKLWRLHLYQVSCPWIYTLILHFTYDEVNGKSLRSVNFRWSWGLI
jgi:hypothetical protein